MKANKTSVNERGYFNTLNQELTPLETIKVLSNAYAIINPICDSLFDLYLNEPAGLTAEETEDIYKAQQSLGEIISRIEKEVEIEYIKLKKQTKNFTK